jgi:hypothetical protein
MDRYASEGGLAASDVRRSWRTTRIFRRSEHHKWESLPDRAGKSMINFLPLPYEVLHLLQLSSDRGSE